MRGWRGRGEVACFGIHSAACMQLPSRAPLETLLPLNISGLQPQTNARRPFGFWVSFGTWFDSTYPARHPAQSHPTSWSSHFPHGLHTVWDMTRATETAPTPVGVQSCPVRVHQRMGCDTIHCPPFPAPYKSLLHPPPLIHALASGWLGLNVPFPLPFPSAPPAPPSLSPAVRTAPPPPPRPDVMRAPGSHSARTALAVPARYCCYCCWCWC